jgi:hypothetical protein
VLHPVGNRLSSDIVSVVYDLSRPVGGILEAIREVTGLLFETISIVSSTFPQFGIILVIVKHLQVSWREDLPSDNHQTYH